MDFNTAQEIIAGMVFGAQKARSTTLENFGDLGEDMLSDLSPWLFGPKNVLPALLKLQRETNLSGIIRGADLYNFVFIASRLEPSILMVAAVAGFEAPEEPLTEWMAQEYYRF